MHKTEGLTDETGLVSVWHLNEGSGTSTDDPKGNNDGTINGATWVSSSTAPFGTKGAFVATTTQTSVGPSGGQIKITITSTPSDANNLGVYQFGSLSGDPVTSGETFPSGFEKRSNIIWGITERGDLTATLVFDYSGQGGVSNASTIEILKRDDADDTSWDEVTESSPDDGAYTITLTGITTFSEYALGAKSDNSLPVELTSFTAKQEGSAVVLEWVTESEIENLGFILERRDSKLEIRNWEEIASYITDSRLQGQGSVTHRTEYSYTDNTVETGKTYEYRLADVSYDGVVEYHALTFLTVEEYEPLPERFIVYQNYPNPFNAQTTISYYLPNESYVTVSIYDITGRKLETLVNSRVVSGRHKVRWDASNLASGVYIYRIETEQGIAVKKLVLLK